MFVLHCHVVGTLVQKQFQLIISKLNRMDEKLDNFSRKLHAYSRGSSSHSGSGDVSTKPNGMNIPADTMKDISTSAVWWYRMSVSGNHWQVKSVLFHSHL